MIYLPKLLVMQADLRHWDTIDEMVRFVQDGGFWTHEYLSSYSKLKKLDRVSPLISITEFEDKLQYLHDGHHRSVATWLGGRNYLRDDEYQLSNWKYQDYIDLVPENNWFTPFDPRTHIRTADFNKFKNNARSKYNEGINHVNLSTWIADHQHEFLVQRSLKYIPDLAKSISR